MSEVLRAIMEKNCTYSQVAFYDVVYETIATGGATQFQPKQIFITVPSDRYFLAMGALQCTALAGLGGTLGWTNKNDVNTFDVLRGMNLEPFANVPSIKINVAYNLNNMTAWDEYVLYSPGEQIGVNETVQTVGINNEAYETYVVISGIEYFMPSGASTGNGW
jgi:hypothetical protein